MTRFLPARGPALLGALMLGLAGCAQPQPMMAGNPNPPIPALPAEARPLPPVSAVALTWQPGHYDWNGTSYSFVPGGYVPAAGHATWMPAYWALQGGQWVWMPAHWTA